MSTLKTRNLTRSPNPGGRTSRGGITLAVVLTGLLLASQAQAMDCTQYVWGRLASAYPTKNFSALNGNAGTWVNATIRTVGVMAVNNRPFAGAIMVFAGSADRSRYPSYAKFAADTYGHVAVVNGVTSSSAISVSQANWNNDGKIDTNAKVTTSDSWQTASVENTRTGQMGAGRYAVAGFINASAFPAKKK